MAPTIVAVVPVAFYAEKHLEMTDAFLEALEPEVDRIGVWFNGGTLGQQGRRLLSRTMLMGSKFEVHDAEGWRFYRMWNDGARWARELGAEAALYLNNDITFPPGAIRTLGEILIDQPDDVAVVSPDQNADTLSPTAAEDVNLMPAYRGLLGWCFAIRPTYWQFINEEYYSWFGDDELCRMIEDAGYKGKRAKGVPVFHPTPETTMSYLEGIWELRRKDEAVYNATWA